MLGRLYPDLGAGGLSGVLRGMLERVGSHVLPEPGARRDHAVFKFGDREASLCTAVQERLFHIDLRAEGIQFASAWTESLDSIVAVLVDWLGPGAPGAAEIGAQHAFLNVDAFALAYEQGRALEYEWDDILGRPTWWFGPILRAAASHRELRRLYPFLMWHQTLLGFSRWAGYPWSDDLPCIYVPTDPATGHDFLLGPYRGEGELVYPTTFDVYSTVAALGPLAFDFLPRPDRRALVGSGDAETALGLLLTALPARI